MLTRSHKVGTANIYKTMYKWIQTSFKSSLGYT